MNQRSLENAQDVESFVSKPVFFPVSKTKLAVMSAATFGLYITYWFYRNWSLVRQREKSKLWPVGRALFEFFFCYALFRRVAAADERWADHSRWFGALLATGWIVINLCALLPGAFCVLYLLLPCFLFPVQNAINRINTQHAPGHDSNARFGIWNILCVVATFAALAATAWPALFAAIDLI